MKDEEYMADFCLVSKRTLDPVHFQIFRFHYLLGADWKLCCRRLNMDRGTFFHTVYEIQAKLGRVFRELTPFSLFPLDEYFGGTVRKELPGVNRVVLMPVGRKRRRLNPPVLKAA